MTGGGPRQGTLRYARTFVTVALARGIGRLGRCGRVCAWLAVLLMTGVPCSFAQGEVIDRVLAVAAGEVITLSDVRAARALGRVDPRDAADPVRVVLSQLTDRALVLAEVNRFAPPEPAVVAIEEALDAVTARFPSAQAFDTALTQLGIDRAFVRDLLREDLRIRAYLDQRFTADTPAEQRKLVDDWIAGLRRRADIIDLYEPEVSAPASGTAPPARD